MDWRSTVSPLSVKMPFSNAYHDSQSSALMLLYAAVTLVQHGRLVAAADAPPLGWVEAPDALGAGVPAPPAHAVARIASTATRTIAVLLITPTFRSSPDLRTPALEAVLDALEDRREQHAGAGDEHHPGEHLRRLERLAGDRHEHADAVPRSDELADDHTRERVPHAEPEAGEDERHRAGEHDAPEDEGVGRAERPRDPQQRGLRVPDAGHRVDDDREEGTEKDDRDLGLDVDAEPDDEQREQDDPRRAVEEFHDRVHRVLDPRVPAHRQAQAEAHDDGQPEADDELLAARGHVEPDVALLDQLHERLRAVDGAGQEQDRHEPGVRDELPSREDDGHADHAHDERLVLLRPARPDRGARLAGGHGRTRVPGRHRLRQQHLLHAAGTPAMSRSAGTASSSWIDSQISSSYVRNCGSRLIRRSRGRERVMSTVVFTRPGRRVNTMTRSAR